MRYVLLIYGSEAASAGMAQEERVALMQAHSAFAQEAQERSLLTGGEPLQPTSPLKRGTGGIDAAYPGWPDDA